MRILLLYLVVSGLLVYSFRDWYKGLCGLIVLSAIAEHPDMPKMLLHINGLNPWNALLLAVLCGWFLSRDRERLTFDPPLLLTVLGVAYFIVVLISSLRMLAHPTNIPISQGENIAYCINTMRFVIPGLLLFDGCRSRPRLNLAVLALLAYYLLIAVEIVKWVPPWYALDAADLERRSREILRKEIGLYRTDLSMMMAGAAWACVSASVLFKHRTVRLVLFGGFCIATLAVALTAGRAGYVTWAAVGMCIAVLRFRKALFLVPLAVVLAMWLLPGVTVRMSEGFSSKNEMGEGVDDTAVTAGRSEFWPAVIETIGLRPLTGYGRMAMITTGLSTTAGVGEIVPHPHNFYLEILLDNGWLGFVPVMGFFIYLLVIGFRLMLDSRSPLFLAGGGVPMALVLAFLISGVGGRHYYPDENSYGMWCGIGLLVRTWVERKRSLEARPTGGRRATVARPRRSAPAPQQVRAAHS